MNPPQSLILIPYPSCLIHTTGVRQVGDDQDAGEGAEHVRREGHHLRDTGSELRVWEALALSHSGCLSVFTTKVEYASNPTGIDLRSRRVSLAQGCGKSEMIRTLAKAQNMFGEKATINFLNPKSVTRNELYGYQPVSRIFLCRYRARREHLTTLKGLLSDQRRDCLICAAFGLHKTLIRR